MLNQIISRMLLWSRFTKSAFLVIYDSSILLLSLFLSVLLQQNNFSSFEDLNFLYFLMAPLIGIPIFIFFDLYRSIIRFIGFKEIWAIVKAVTLFIFLWSLWVVYLTKIIEIPVYIIYWMVVLLGITSSRMLASWIFAERFSSSNVVIYGAGLAGIQLATALRYSSEMKPIAFIDEDKSIQGNYLSGLKVFSPNKLDKLIRRKRIQEVLIAIPSARKSVLQEILSRIEEFPVKVRILPGVAELAQGKVSVSDLKVLDVSDLLGREITKPNTDLLFKNIHSKNVMVTGAGGSIGSELSRQILKVKPDLLVLFELSEFSLYEIEKELSESFPDISIKPILGNVTDRARLEEVCSTFRIDTIYHAAAYKHVPMVEMNTIQSIENNIFGTLACAEVAILNKVETFVLVSTDKAVRPTNVMGATKRFSELILQALSARDRLQDKDPVTRIAIVRFGNVLGSSGSAVPLFREQLEKGGPITVTDPEVIRYFMSIPEAAQLVIQAGAMGQNADIFVLDMGEPIKILDLAKRMIRLSGLEVRDSKNPGGDIEITFTGLREGEKLYEELLIGDDVTSTEHNRIMRAKENFSSWEEILERLNQFKEAILDRDQEKIHKILLNSVDGFDPKTGVNDLIFRKKKN